MTEASKFLLASIAVALVASSFCNVAADNKTTSAVTLHVIDLPMKINILGIASQYSNSQNSKPVTVTFNVSSIFVHGICGLNASNFKLTTISAPQHAPTVVITGLYPWNDPQAANNCKYNISIAPLMIPGIKTKWVNGIYRERLDYLVGGQVKANKTFSFMIGT